MEGGADEAEMILEKMALILCEHVHSFALKHAAEGSRMPALPLSRTQAGSSWANFLPAASNAGLKLHWQKPVCHKSTGNEMRELFAMMNALLREGHVVGTI